MMQGVTSSHDKQFSGSFDVTQFFRCINLSCISLKTKTKALTIK